MPHNVDHRCCGCCACTSSSNKGAHHTDAFTTMELPNSASQEVGSASQEVGSASQVFGGLKKSHHRIWTQALILLRFH